MAYTIEDRLIATRNRPSGFDYMRVVLALGVIVFHCALICYGEQFQDQIWNGPFRAPMAAILPMFFSLSGFLVAGSLERSQTLITFLGLRVLRIVPALAVEVLLSAFILGPLFTTRSLQSYFADPEFSSYLLNVTGYIHYYLPGLFRSNPMAKVNGQLWTVPWELSCYISLSVIAVLGIFKRREFFLLFMVGAYLAYAVRSFYSHTSLVGPVGGRALVMMFIAGVFIYRFKDKIIWSRGLFLLSALLMLGLLAVPDGERFAALPAAYVTVYLGLFNPPRNKLILSGDYSYGLFLYGFPVQQALVASSPFFAVWYWNLPAAIFCTAIIAVASWWFVEKPVLAQRDKLKGIEKKFIMAYPGFLG